MRPLSSAIAKVEERLGQLGHSPPSMAIPELYNVLGPEQKQLWDKAESDLEEASRGQCAMLRSVACEQYVLIMGELIDFAARKARHARIARRLGEDCWSAREEG